MTKDEYWLKQLEKNNKLINPEHKVQITAANLRKLLADAWEKGFNHQRANSSYSIREQVDKIFAAEEDDE